MTRTADDPALRAALELSQRYGMLGARPVADVIEQATAFLPALAGLHAGALVVDLGSGGGVPGLVIAWLRPDLRIVLVDRRATRADHLRRLVLRLGLADQVDVLSLDAAAVAARLPGPAAAVVARGFGPPSGLLAAARPLLAPAGLVIVTEPPGTAAERWSPELLASVALRRVASPDTRIAVFEAFDDTERRVPRGTSRRRGDR